MIYTAVASIGFTILMVLSGVGMFGEDRWWLGLAAGAVVAIAWHMNRRLGSVLGLLGMGLLFLAAVGFASELADADRAMFNGMAAGCLLGLAIGAALRWRHVKSNLIDLARIEGVRWLSKLLGDRSAR